MDGIRRAALVLSLLVTSTIISEVNSQDCKVAGQGCADSGQCCGGCCIRGQCIDTTRDCMYVGSVCRHHSCIGEADCQVYLPPECPGCEPIPVCVVSPGPPNANATAVRDDTATQATQSRACRVIETIHLYFITSLILYLYT